jgi:hypothetical protein
MIIGKLRSKEGLEALQSLPREYLEDLRLKIPENSGKLMIDVISALLDRLGAHEEGIAAITDMVEKKKYGTMFDAFVGTGFSDYKTLTVGSTTYTRKQACWAAAMEAWGASLIASPILYFVHQELWGLPYRRIMIF